eukprot:6187084-Pleurochrysis_carterae.AAC.2
MPAASALAAPSHQSSNDEQKASGNAPKPVDSAVTHPYHHTCCTERPPYSCPVQRQANSAVSPAMTRASVYWKTYGRFILLFTTDASCCCGAASTFCSSAGIFDDGTTLSATGAAKV